MGYEVIDACDGWAVRQRLQMTVTNRDGQDIEMVSDYATWEVEGRAVVPLPYEADHRYGDH